MVLFSVAFDVHSNSVNYIKLTAAMEAKVNILILRVSKGFGIVVWPGYSNEGLNLLQHPISCCLCFVKSIRPNCPISFYIVFRKISGLLE